MQKRDERDMEEQKEHLKQKICRFNDTDVLFLEGEEEEMITKLQVKCGKTKQKLHKIINVL
jgi:uncharacterized protein YjbJ (UPF0337 family)